MVFDIVLLTCERFLKNNAHTQHVIGEDTLLQKSFEKKGLTVGRRKWDDKDFDWASAKSVMFRSTWDYVERYQEFLEWIKDTSSKTNMINPANQILWNIDKHYLVDLQDKGIDIVKTQFIEKGNKRKIGTWLDDLGWKEAVFKPCVSASGYHTYRVNRSTCDVQEELFHEIVEEHSMMLQPFLKSVLTKGEVSHIVVGGKHVYALRKMPKDGDFRVQGDFGGTVSRCEANDQEKDFAEKVTFACDPIPCYARVDVMWDDDGQLALVELELIEPEMWFFKQPSIAGLIANDVAARMLKESPFINHNENI